MNHDDLDRQIREALRAEPSPQQMARLERFWHQQSRSERRRRRLRREATWAVAAAAAILVAVCVSIRAWQHRPGGRPVANQTPTALVDGPPEVSPIKDVDLPAAPSPVEQPGQTRLSAGRPPTAYERFFFAARSRASAATDSPPTVATQSRPPADQRDAQSEPLLADGQPKTDPDQPVDPEHLVRLVPRINDPQRRAALFRRLLAADSDVALRDYLSFVYDLTTRAEALVVADVVSGPLLERLLYLLEDEEKPVRFSAALVLARADGPEVAGALIDLVARQPSDPADDARRTEAWIALMACRDRQTGEFLAYAMSQPRLLKHLNRARVQWQRITLSPL